MTDPALLRDMVEALKPFRTVHHFMERISADWPDDKPNSEFIPGGWPTWGDFRKAAEVYARAEAALGKGG